MRKQIELFLMFFTILFPSLVQSSTDCGLFGMNCLQPKMTVSNYDPDLAFDGTTLFGLKQKNGKNALIEVNMKGEQVWQYVLPDEISGSKYNVIADVERLSNGNTLFQVRGEWDKQGNQKSIGSGNFEITHDGELVWSYKDTGASHDIDRLKNGNTIWARGWAKKGDPHVVEVNSKGNVVWQWDAMKEFNVDPYSEVEREGWIHVNAVTRLEDGNTLISLRNLQMVVKVNPQGEVIWSQKFYCGKAEDAWSLGHSQDLPLGCNPHDPELQSNGNMLLSVRHPYKSYELNSIGKVHWEISSDFLELKSYRSRDIDRLPNGNTLVQVDSMLYEVTPDKQIAWLLNFDEIAWLHPGKAKRKWKDKTKEFWKQFKFKQLYKAQRIGF